MATKQGKTVPSIVFILEYTLPQSGKTLTFKEYVDYMQRKEATSMESEQTTSTEIEKLNFAVTEDDYQGYLKRRELYLEGREELLKSDDVDDAFLDTIAELVPEQTFSFKEYVEYMNRTYATKMSEEEEITDERTPLFNETYNNAPKSEVQKIKGKLDQAYQNGSPMWKGVLSFDNDFLAKEGLYDKEKQTVNQDLLKEAVRSAMPDILGREGIQESAFWWGDIHHNTDNIHIHIGISEIESNRSKVFYAPRQQWEYKGHFSQKTMKAMKTKVYNRLLSADHKTRLVLEQQKIANLRTDLLSGSTQKELMEDPKNQLAQFYLQQVYNHLPENTKWRYGSNAVNMQQSKFFLKKFMENYFKNDGKDLYNQFQEANINLLKEYENAYQAVEKNRAYEKMRKVDGKEVHTTAFTKGSQLSVALEKRMKDLEERIGNQILRYLRDHPPKEESNIANFSKGNQERVLAVFPDAVAVHQKKSWEKQGYRVRPDAKPVPLLLNVGKDEDGMPRFEEVEYYELSQVQLVAPKKPSASQILQMDEEDIIDYIEFLKQYNPEDEGIKAELGAYKYALKLKGLEQQEKLLQQGLSNLSKVNPLASDQGFVNCKTKEFQERLTLIRLQKVPNFALNEQQIAQKHELSKKYKSVVQIPINEVTQKYLQQRLLELNQEEKLAEQVQDEAIFQFLLPAMEKSTYLEFIDLQKQILQTKGRICDNNDTLKVIDDSKLRSENGRLFNELKKLYAKIEGREFEEQYQSGRFFHREARMGVNHSYSREELARNLTKKKLPPKLSSNYLRGLVHALNAGKNRSYEALMAKVRSDRREEEEEKREERREGRSR
ncbi:relaxase MobL [Enterococcus cecorum]|uniref:MobP2 family relaxase n=1 Tax=Enterococcus cecorum TaxID=44008 RepID=UPI001FABBF5B|nr:MobP2 family relaxase [Enterococcus cecorum]MCJ0522618.1 relaxase MobL [Enterococcus cecorum]MCJ0560774.1 relaxase MobL [Enterococcus cecorum]